MLLKRNLRRTRYTDKPEFSETSGWLLFEKLGLPPLKKTKTGYSTDVSVLQMLASSPGGDVPSLLLEHRELSKMLTGFVHPFLKARDETTDVFILPSSMS
jgi:DNA polymerase I-like protein with 3'-5' exonuclease and polymerase domains